MTTLTLVPKPTTEQEFLAIFNRLCVALREQQDDSGITQGVYWEALSDLSTTALEAGAQRLMRQQGRRWFPTTSEWRTEAEKAQTEALKAALPPARETPWRHECRDCEDTGWVRGLTCPGDSTCGRTDPHAAHDFTRACPCRPENRTYRRKLLAGGGAS